MLKKSRAGSPLVGCAVLLALGLHGSPVAAQQFVPFACSQCPTYTTTNWYYSTSGYTSLVPQDDFCVGPAADPCPHYLNNIESLQRIVANRNVADFRFKAEFFETEPNYDYLEFGAWGGPYVRLSGA